MPWPNRAALLTMVRLAAGARLGDTMRALLVLASGKRVRAWGQLCRLAQQRPDFHDYWSRHVSPRLAAEWCSDAAVPPIACLIFSDDRPQSSLAATLSSLRLSFGSEAAIWTSGANVAGCQQFAGPAASELKDQIAAIKASTGVAWIFACRAGDTVEPALGRALGTAFGMAPDSRLVFWDEDADDGERRTTAWIKPAWDPLLHFSRDGLGGACVLHIDTALAAATRGTIPPNGPAGFSAIAMAIAAADHAPPFHIPLLLSHRRDGRAFAGSAAWPAIARSAWPEGTELAMADDGSPHVRVQPPAPGHWPAVTIIIPTRDRPELLGPCLASLDRLTYPGDVDIIIVDNGSSDPAALALLAKVAKDGKFRVLSDDGPFNFSRLNNRAVATARGALLCLLNNDVEALDGEWLAAMARHAVQPGVGAVGAMLLYPDGHIQHAGVAIGMGGAAGHVQRGADPADSFHQSWHAVTRRVSAVTAACLVVRRESYLAVGGLDEEGFAVAFNDVDFCLKLQDAGLANVYCAEARLLHRESRSRGSDYEPAQFARFSGELARLQQRWNTLTAVDPWFSPLFANSSERCVLRI
jgi:GT2 family glycosyltransferase